MKLILAFCFIGVALALPHPKQRYGNPDEWGQYYQGDMRMKSGQFPKNGILGDQYRWTGGIVPYEFNPNFNTSKIPIVQRAIDDYLSLTGGCIQFVARAGEANYISFADTDPDGCWSYVGKQGGKQEINYPIWCIDQYGSVQHEMYHALGFFHEQSRTDRDNYVIIHSENIQAGAANNFDKYDANTIDPFGQPYDYGSVMHYSGKAFSKNGLLTIETIDPAAQNTIGQRVGLSNIDLAKLLAMYNC